MKSIKLAGIILIVSLVYACGTTDGKIELVDDSEQKENIDKENTDTKTDKIDPNFALKDGNIDNDLYSFSYPIDWNRQMEIKAPLHFATVSPPDGKDDKFTENIYLVVNPYTDQTNSDPADIKAKLETLAQETKDQIKILPKGKFISESFLMKHGKQCHQINYEGNDGTNDLSIIQRVYLDKGRSYTFFYSGELNGGFEKHKPEAMKMMESFVIK